MPGSDPKTGDVYYYPYVWKRQGGDWAEPEKDRPCCVILRLTGGAFRGSNVFMLALTQTGVPIGGFGEVVPSEHIRGLKRLDDTKPTHIVLSEYNADISEHPSFEDVEYLGSLPMVYVKQVLEKLIPFLKSGVGEVARSDVARGASR